MRKAIDRAARDDRGFSLIDVVVTVAIVVALSVGGFVSYTGLINSAKEAMALNGVNKIELRLVLLQSEGIGGSVETIVKEYNSTTRGMAAEVVSLPGGNYNIAVGSDNDGDGAIDDDPEIFAEKPLKF